jgi:hypothetical protein
VRLRAETADKWGCITRARRWTFSEAADALADFYLANVGDIPLPPGNGDTVGQPSIPGSTVSTAGQSGEYTAPPDEPSGGAFSGVAPGPPAAAPRPPDGA